MKDILYHLAHKYPGKIPALALRMERNPTVLGHKFNVNNTTHFLTTEELEMTGDFCDANILLAEYFARKANAVVVKLPDVPFVDDMELLDGFMNVVNELGQLSQEFQRDWADGRIDAVEFGRIKDEASEVQSKLLAFINRIEQIVEKPKSAPHKD